MLIGSVCAPDKATLKAENHALQCTAAGPYNGILSTLLGVGSVCGLGPDLVGIHSLSLAARYRVAACSTTLSRGLGKLSTARGHNCIPPFALSQLGKIISCFPSWPRSRKLQLACFWSNTINKTLLGLFVVVPRESRDRSVVIVLLTSCSTWKVSPRASRPVWVTRWLLSHPL